MLDKIIVGVGLGLGLVAGGIGVKRMIEKELYTVKFQEVNKQITPIPTTAQPAQPAQAPQATTTVQLSVPPMSEVSSSEIEFLNKSLTMALAMGKHPVGYSWDKYTLTVYVQ